MNQNPIDRSRFEAIEAYVLGSMLTTEHDAFEQEMAKDAALRAEVDLQRENTLAVELGGMERTLRMLGAEHDGSATKENSGWSQYLKYAAVVAIVLSGAFWMLTRPSANERLFAENFNVDPGLPVPMSATDKPAFHDAMVAYKLGDFAEARGKWSSLLQAEPTNDTLRYYIASAALAMDDAAAAIPLFEGVAADTASAFHDKSQWYLFLAYVKAGNGAKAKATRLDDDPAYGDRARAIKAELK
ncbi:MAG: hypothetical protein ABI599_09005 [Flavobacteriales bacterium]